MNFRRILTLLLALLMCALAFSACGESSEMTQEKFNRKMDELVSLLNYDGKTPEEIEVLKDIYYNDTVEEEPMRVYFEPLDAIVDELCFIYLEWGEDAWIMEKAICYPYFEMMCEYIKICDFDRLMVAAHNDGSYHCFMKQWTDYMTSGETVIYTAMMQVFPEKFISLNLEANQTTGYYVDHPNAFPTTRTEYYGSGMTNSYVVSYYGDFAIQEAEEWSYDDGKLGWENGIFYDTPGYYYQTTRRDLYYKGRYFLSMEEDITTIFVYETDQYMYKFKLKGGDTVINYGYFESNRLL